MNAPPIIRPFIPSVEEIAREVLRVNPPAKVEPFPDNSEPWGWDAEPEPYPFWKDEQ